MHYKIRLSEKANQDIDRITEYLQQFSYNTYKVIEKINKDIENLKYMPQIHKTLIYLKDNNGEYRRIISGKYSIIYKIKNKEIIILRIFNQKENYLNQSRFIIKEELQKYFIKRRNNKMIKFRTLKNSYAKLKENYTHIITEEEALNRYMNILIDEAEEDLRNGGETITLEEWREELMREYNVIL